MPIDGRLPTYGRIANYWKDNLPLVGRSKSVLTILTADFHKFKYYDKLIARNKF